MIKSRVCTEVRGEADGDFGREVEGRSLMARKVYTALQCVPYNTPSNSVCVCFCLTD